jgi:hypothetical protein
MPSIEDIIKKEEEYYLINNNIKITYDQLLILSKLKNIKSENFIFNDENNLWYYKNYKSNKSLIELFYPDKKILDIKFKNNNYNDYINIEIILNLKYSNSFIDPENCEILNIGTTYLITEGKCAGEYRNMYWKVKDNNNNIYYIMNIKNNIYTKISCDDIEKVLCLYEKRRTWKLSQNGYITTTITLNEKQKVYYLHQLIMDVHNEDLTSFEKTVDHINRDKLDNRKENLRLVNMSVQNSNRDKQKRHKNACDLPEGITVLPKYIVYGKEKLDDDKYREYFYICGHPKLERWNSSKSNKVSIHQKLEMTIAKINELEDSNIITIPNDNDVDLPLYIRLIISNEKYQLLYDWKTPDIRYSLKMVLKSTNIQDELNTFIDKINEKYLNLNMQKYTIKNKNYKINEEDISILQESNNAIKITLPPNFLFVKDKGSFHLQYSKNINKEKIAKKMKITSNNIQEEFNNLILILKNKYPELNIFPENYIIPEKINIIPESNTPSQRPETTLTRQRHEINTTSLSPETNTTSLSPEINTTSQSHETNTTSQNPETNSTNQNPETNSTIAPFIPNNNVKKPIMPTNFSICNVKNIDYIQFCKKIDDKKYQYKTKINSYDLQDELNNFVIYINQHYINIGDASNYTIINTKNWQTLNKIVLHEDTELKQKNRNKTLKSIEKKKQEIGEEEYKKQKNEYMKNYRN